MRRVGYQPTFEEGAAAEQHMQGACMGGSAPADVAIFEPGTFRPRVAWPFARCAYVSIAAMGPDRGSTAAEVWETGMGGDTAVGPIWAPPTADTS